MKRRQSIFRKFPVTAVSPAVLANDKLSLEARGLYALICAQDGGQLGDEDLFDYVGYTVKTIDKLLDELRNESLVMDMPHER